MPGRKFEQIAGITYRYSINGQEKDRELNENITTALFWEYDSRIARRWNIDPKLSAFNSSYTCFENNPIFLIDPNGDKVRNGDELLAEKKRKNQKLREDYLNDLKTRYKITDGMDKKKFIAAGGTKEQWKEYQNQVSYTNKGKKELGVLEDNAKKTEAIIAKWKLKSPNIFNEVDSKATDFILMTVEFRVDESTAGENKINFGVTEEAPTLVAEISSGETALTIQNAVAVNVNQNVDLDNPEPTIEYKNPDKNGKTVNEQYFLNHEAGHFLYVIANTLAYRNFIRKMKKEKKDFDGGHSDDDESGKNAVRYGSVKDMPKKN